MQEEKLNLSDRDKVMHMVVSCTLTIGLYFIFKKLDVVDSLAIAFSAMSIGALVIGKELIDSMRGDNHFCVNDMIADGIGITVGVFVCLF